MRATALWETGTATVCRRRAKNSSMGKIQFVEDGYKDKAFSCNLLEASRMLCN